MFMTVNTQLTKRESEILDLVCLGHAYKTIGVMLGMELCTVATHMQKMFRKTDSNSAPQLISKLSGWRPKIEIKNAMEE